MIQLQDDIVWVRFADGRLAPFDEQRLALSIQKAAERTGLSDWWLAESIAAAVHVYASHSRTNGVIQSSKITEIVAVALSELGHSRISEAYAAGRNRAAVHLNELAGGMSAAFELEFFQQLDRALDAAANRRLLVMEVDGLRACVMRLRGAQRWTAGCREFAEDIVEYVRARVTRVRPRRAASLKLAVVE
jgi:hypothetical protein